jgi:hypothetical protein
VSPYLRVLVVGCAAVLAFDAVASLASVALGFPYWYAGIGSLIIYLLVGAAAVRHVSIRLSALTGALVGLVDATIGWAISWLLGPGRVPAGSLTRARFVVTAVLVSLLAGAVASIGASLNRRGSASTHAAA